MLVCDTSCSKPDTFGEQLGDGFLFKKKRRKVHKKHQGRLYMPFEPDCRDGIRLTGEQGEGFCGGQ